MKLSNLGEAQDLHSLEADKASRSRISPSSSSNLNQSKFKMENPKVPASLTRKWFLLVLLMKIGIMDLIMFSRATSEDQNGNIPATGLLCISDCVTCPVICSPPPPPPSPEESEPPPSPRVHHHSPPPTSELPPLPPPPPPPPSYFSWDATPPPPSVYTYNPAIQVQPGMGDQHNYSYPYYYFYSSKAPPLSLHASIFVMILLCFGVML